jgi:hypothetical protein
LPSLEDAQAWADANPFVAAGVFANISEPVNLSPYRCGGANEAIAADGGRKCVQHN